MIFPVNFHLAGIEINSHIVFEELGFLIGFRYYLYLRKRSKDLISNLNRIWIFCGAGIGALILSRLLADLEQPLTFFNKATPFIYYYTNQTIIGGLLGGLIGTEITKKIIKINVSSGDLFTFPLILAMCIGRIGCFLAGLNDNTFGISTSLPWGIDFGDGIKRHPTNLYEIIFLLLLGLTLVRIKRRHILKNGSLFKLFMVSYLSFRLLAEFIKPDYRFPFGLSVLQLACIAGLVYYYKVFIQSPFLQQEQEIAPIIELNQQELH